MATMWCICISVKTPWIDKLLGLKSQKSGKLWQLSLLKSAMDSYHKIATGITNCDGFYKLRQIRSVSLFILSQAASLSYRIFIVASRAASRS